MIEGTGGQLDIEVVAGGRSLRAATGPHIGSILNPASYDDVVDKFHRFSRHLLDADTRARLVEGVAHLEEVDDVAELVGLIRGPLSS
jgi:hypothetical protein